MRTAKGAKDAERGRGERRYCAGNDGSGIDGCGGDVLIPGVVCGEGNETIEASSAAEAHGVAGLGVGRWREKTERKEGDERIIHDPHDSP